MRSTRAEFIQTPKGVRVSIVCTRCARPIRSHYDGSRVGERCGCRATSERYR